MEALRYNNPSKKIEYIVHIAFPSHIFTDAFCEE